MATALVWAGRAVARSLSEAAATLGESMTGMYAPAGAEPTFIPLDEFMSDQFLKDVEGDMASHDLVLEDAFDAGDAYSAE